MEAFIKDIFAVKESIEKMRFEYCLRKKKIKINNKKNEFLIKIANNIHL